MNKLVTHLLYRAGYELRPVGLPADDGYLDRPEFQYVLWLDRVYAKIARVPGNIVEIGVARGRNSIIFGRLIELYGEESVRSYYGFDTFEGYNLQDLQQDKHLSAEAFKGIRYEWVLQRIADVGLAGVSHLVKGDVRQTASKFVEGGGPNFQPGHLKIALLYIDCNAYDPAIFSMRYFSGFMPSGGIICIDEKMQGGETRALDTFCRERGQRPVRDPGPFGLPAYVEIP